MLFAVTITDPDFFISYGLFRFFEKKKIKEEIPDKRTGEPVMAIVIAAMLTFLYLVFSMIQIMELFLGKMTLPAGYTYASYAREGFFQLLTVSLLNLVIVLVMLTYFRESGVLKGILAVMSMCTFIMIASSAMRMIIYISYYCLTYLRILVLWGLAVLAPLFAGVLVSIYNHSFHLLRYSMVVVTVLYLALSFAHPDYLIAKWNLSYTQEGQTGILGEQTKPFKDFRTIRHLSTDAAPAVAEYCRENGVNAETAMESYFAQMHENAKDMGIRTFNFSLYLARNSKR